jgi:hypothetical protein
MPSATQSEWRALGLILRRNILPLNIVKEL